MIFGHWIVCTIFFFFYRASTSTTSTTWHFLQILRRHRRCWLCCCQLHLPLQRSKFNVNKFVFIFLEFDKMKRNLFHYFRGESAFHAMKASCGWAKFPMLHRIPALNPDIPITFIYGARSWIDRFPGQTIKEMRNGSAVDIHVPPLILIFVINCDFLN